MSQSVHLKARVKGGTRGAIIIALGGDLLVAVAKFVAAALTGSSAMMSEGVHSLTDSLTGIILIHGTRASRHPSTAEHQLGFGREVFFWNFIVAMTILALGAGVALVDGIHQYLAPRALEAPSVIYGVLGVAFVSEVVSLLAAMREAAREKGGMAWRRYLGSSRNTTSLTVLFGSASGILGLLTAAAGTLASTVLHRPEYDGIASIVIAGFLTVTALVLAKNNKDMLIGVPAFKPTIRSILAIAGGHPHVCKANGTLSVHLAPDEILVALSVEFLREATTLTIECAIDEIDRSIRRAHPDVVLFLIKPQSADQFETISRGRGW